MTFFGYIIVDACIISLNLNCILQLKQFYNIATKVSCRKSATTFGDLPDCLQGSKIPSESCCQMGAFSLNSCCAPLNRSCLSHTSVPNRNVHDNKILYCASSILVNMWLEIFWYLAHFIIFYPFCRFWLQRPHRYLGSCGTRTGCSGETGSRIPHHHALQETLP